MQTSWVVCSCCSTSSVVFVVTSGPESTTTSPSSRTTCRFTLVSICRVVVISFFLRVSHSSENRKRALSFSARHSAKRAKPISRYRTSGHKTRPMSPQRRGRGRRGRDVLCLVPCRRSVVVSYRAFVGAFAPNERDNSRAPSEQLPLQSRCSSRKANGNYHRWKIHLALAAVNYYFYLRLVEAKAPIAKKYLSVERWLLRIGRCAISRSTSRALISGNVRLSSSRTSVF